ncbi:hypothetical protein F4780DRAFT_143458 [Xylariomycetidae sp. FL0641]|nr:hypothetical protein F4780DRAFT_143458 [Xylariomycetidae sp. FL0641]
MDSSIRGVQSRCESGLDHIGSGLSWLMLRHPATQVDGAAPPNPFEPEEPSLPASSACSCYSSTRRPEHPSKPQPRLRARLLVVGRRVLPVNPSSCLARSARPYHHGTPWYTFPLIARRHRGAECSRSHRGRQVARPLEIPRSYIPAPPRRRYRGQCQRRPVGTRRGARPAAIGPAPAAPCLAGPCWCRLVQAGAMVGSAGTALIGAGAAGCRWDGYANVGLLTASFPLPSHNRPPPLHGSPMPARASPCLLQRRALDSCSTTTAESHFLRFLPSSSSHPHPP